VKYSIIIPLAKFNDYLVEAIPHLLNLDYPKEEYEILILPNEIPKRLPKYLKHKQIGIVETGRVSPAVKRDIGASKAEGEILAFIDDDSYPRDDWLITAEKTFDNLKECKAECFSEEFVAINGPAITPNNVTWKEKMSGAFFESKLGGGATHRCRDVGKSFEIDDAPSVNLLVYREAFLEVGGFGSEYWPGEDSIFCQKLKDNGYKLWHQNNLIIFHHRRDTFKKHLKQVLGYGQHRGNFFRKGIGCSRKLSYVIPYLFLIGNITILFFLGWIIIPMLFIYFIIISLNLYSCRNLPIILFLPTIILTFVSHLTYGFFFIKGFCAKDIRSELR